MALHTRHTHMLPCDLERKGVVIETLSKVVHTIVAIETSRTKGDGMGGHETQVYLTVAGITGIGSELRKVAAMTIVTGEQYTGRRTRVSL